MPIAVGETFERYEIESLIGRGGVGEVYRAMDTRLRRKVALKVLRPDRDDPDAVARLFREARAAAALGHPNTVAIHDIGEAEGILYIVMELVTGMPLLAYVADARVPAARKLSWLADVARALSAAHRAGVIHRDVKPSNVMVSDDGVVKVLDFGLARPLAPTSFRTLTGHVLGTPRYMAPEQLAGAEVDARSDQYAFGVTAYELVAGEHPGGAIVGATSPPLLHTVVSEITRSVADVIARTMETRPEDRFPSMDDVVVALEDAIAGRRPRALHDASTAAEGSEVTALEVRGSERIASTMRLVSVAAATTGAPITRPTAARAPSTTPPPPTERTSEPAMSLGPVAEHAASTMHAARTAAPATRSPETAAVSTESSSALRAADPTPAEPEVDPLSEPAAQARPATYATLAKTLVTAGNVPPPPTTASSRLRPGASEGLIAAPRPRPKLDAPAEKPAAPPVERQTPRMLPVPAPEAPSSPEPGATEGEDVPSSPIAASRGVGSGTVIVLAIAVLGLCAFAGAYYGSRALTHNPAGPAPSGAR